MDQDVWSKLKFINEKDIKFLKENWCINITFLGEYDVVATYKYNVIRVFCATSYLFRSLLVL